MVLKSRQPMWQRILLSWPVIILMFAIALTFAWGVYDMYQRQQLTTTKEKKIRNELNVVQKRKERMANELNKIKTSSGIEEQLRSQFDVAKEGEHLLIVVDKKEQSSEINNRKQKPWYKSLLDIFKW